MPLERLEAQICELAGHLTAATCRFLILLADFDARRGWASWEMNSCASGCRGSARCPPARRGNQLERFSRAHRQVSQADDAAAHVRRRLAWRFEDDGSLTGTFRLPPLAGAVLLQALRAAAGDQDHPHDNHDGVLTETVPTETAPGDRPAAGGEHPTVTSSNLADALLVIAEAFLADKIAAADNPEVYQVTVHVGAGALDQGDPAGHTGSRSAGDVSAETPAAAQAPGHPADPARCHVEDGPALSVTTAQMIACTATLSWMRHDHDGTLLGLGRRRRRPNAALRRAARERDKCRCRFPGCESRRVDLHHIQHWINGGRTSLKNLISLCKYHHMLVHDRGYLIAAGPAGTFAFFRPDGAGIPPSPALPPSNGTIGDCHDADITPRRSSRPGTASASTWTTPSISASPMPNTAPASATRPDSTTRPDSAVGPDSRISQ